MKIVFQVGKTELSSRILVPSSRLSEQVRLVVDKAGLMYSLTARESHSGTKPQVLLYSETAVRVLEWDREEDGPVVINLMDVRKLVNAMNQIADEDISLVFDGSAIMYDSPTISFRFGVMVEEAMDKLVLSRKTVGMLIESGKTKFKMECEVLKKLLSVTMCMTSCDRMKIYTVGNSVKCVHSDPQSGSSDRVEMIVSTSYTGSPIGPEDSVIVSEDVFKYLVSNRFDACEVSVSKNGSVLFTIQDDKFAMRYIAPRMLVRS